MKLNLLRLAFGWNHKLWSKPFLELLKKTDLLQKESLHILEIGASRRSCVSLLFGSRINYIEISFYDPQYEAPITTKIDFLKMHLALPAEFKVSHLDAFDLCKTYDLIILKSVMGGIFRENETTMEDVKDFIDKLRHKNLTPSGCLITIDNGKRFISGAFARFGAQKLGWRCFSPNDFCDVTYQSSFGFLNSFSLETRLGHLGYFLDNYLMYYLDCVAYKLIKKYPTVIVTLFKTKN